MNDPAVILLDEPSARLDPGGREHLVSTLQRLGSDPSAPPFAMVTHHVDEIPAAVTHAALMNSGGIMASRPIGEVLDSESISDCFGTPLRLERRDDGRYSAWGR